MIEVGGEVQLAHFTTVLDRAESLGILDSVDRLANGENVQVGNAAYQVLLYQSDTEIAMDAFLQPTSGFVFS